MLWAIGYKEKPDGLEQLYLMEGPDDITEALAKARGILSPVTHKILRMVPERVNEKDSRVDLCHKIAVAINAANKAGRTELRAGADSDHKSGEVIIHSEGEMFIIRSKDIIVQRP